MLTRPKFEIFKTVIIANSVLMMNGLVRSNRTTKILFHNQKMLCNVTVTSRARMIGALNQHVPIWTDLLIETRATTLNTAPATCHVTRTKITRRCLGLDPTDATATPTGRAVVIDPDLLHHGQVTELLSRQVPPMRSPSPAPAALGVTTAQGRSPHHLGGAAATPDVPGITANGGPAHDIQIPELHAGQVPKFRHGPGRVPQTPATFCHAPA